MNPMMLKGWSIDRRLAEPLLKWVLRGRGTEGSLSRKNSGGSSYSVSGLSGKWDTVGGERWGSFLRGLSERR